MELKTYHEGMEWLHSQGIDLPLAGRWDGIIPTAAYKLPKDSGHKTALARFLVNFIPAQQHIIFIVEEHGIWPSSENFSFR